ncbi:MAG: FG-GAP repeat domain-containing protein, partial [bacterium]
SSPVNESYYSDSVTNSPAPVLTKYDEPMGADSGVKDSAISWADMDEDGDHDMVVTGYTGSSKVFDTYKWYFGSLNLDQSFTGKILSSAAWADIDGDGDPDLSVTGASGVFNSVSSDLYETTSGDTLSQIDSLSPGLENSSGKYADIDGDGDQDLALIGYDGSDPRFVIYKNDGTGTFNKYDQPMGSTSGLRYGSIDWADIDNDGDSDLAVTGFDGTYRRFIVYENDGSGNLSVLSQPMGSTYGLEESSIQWADMNQDGYQDLLVTGYDGSEARLIVYHNDGTGGLNNVNERPGVYQSSIDFADAEGDGYPDLMVSGLDDGGARHLHLFRNDGDGTFSFWQTKSGVELVPVNKSSIKWADMEGDGDPDLAVTGTDGSNPRFIIYENQIQ